MLPFSFLKLSSALTTPKPLAAPAPETDMLPKASFNPPRAPSPLEVRAGTALMELCRLAECDRPLLGVGGATNGFVLLSSALVHILNADKGEMDIHVGGRHIALVLPCEGHRVPFPTFVVCQYGF